MNEFSFSARPPGWDESKHGDVYFDVRILAPDLETARDRFRLVYKNAFDIDLPHGALLDEYDEGPADE